MTAQGFLAEGPEGEEYLLTTEPDWGREAYRLVVQKKINGQWTQADGVQEAACREALFGALVDFIVDLCRVLNSSGRKPAADDVAMRSSLCGQARLAQPIRLSKSRESAP